MNKEHCLKEFIRYVTLNVLGMIGISCYILSDTFFIAQGLGSDGLTALNLIIPVYNLMHGCGLMLGMGGASRYSMLKLQGNTGVAAYGVIANLSLVMIAIYTGIGQGIQPLISRYYGMRQQDKIKKIFRYALLTVGLLSVLIYGGVFFGAEGIVGIFNSEADELLQKIAEEGLKLYFTGGIFAGFNIVLAIYFMASDRVRPANLLSSLRGFILMIPLAFVMSEIWKMTGLWMTFPVTELLTAAVGGILFLKNKSRNS